MDLSHFVAKGMSDASMLTEVGVPGVQESSGAIEVHKGVIDLRVGGRLALFHQQWQGAPSWVRKIIKYGLSWKFASKPPLYRKAPVISARLDPSIRELIEKEACRMKMRRKKTCFL